MTVLVAFNKDRPTNIKYFVGCVTKEEDEDGDVKVSFPDEAPKLRENFFHLMCLILELFQNRIYMKFSHF